MMKIDYDSRKEQRNFGIVIAIAVMVLAFVRVGFRAAWGGGVYFPSYVWFAVSSAFLVPALVYPRVLKPLFFLWMQFAFALNFLITRILLTFVFLTMLAPGRFFLAVRRKDPLNRKWQPEAASYWEDPDPNEHPPEFDRYKDQF
jgi:hypothetical protein